MEGVDYLTGQLISEYSVVIHEDGTLEPFTIQINPGRDIAWINRSDATLLLRSETLCQEDGTCFELPIFSRETERFTIPAGTIPGTYQYANTLSGLEDPVGEFIVTNDTVPEPVPVVFEEEEQTEAPVLPTEPEEEEQAPVLPTEPEEEEQAPVLPTEPEEEEQAPVLPAEPEEEDPVPVPPEEPEEIPVTANSSSAASVRPVSIQPEAEEVLPPVFGEEIPEEEAPGQGTALLAELPRNPYTVGSGFAPPPSNAPAPLHGGAPLPPVSQHKPFKQPETGMGTWIALALSCIGGAVILRSLRGTTLVVPAGR